MTSHSPIIEATALGVIAGAWLQIIPAVAALAAVIWYAILIWESETVRGWAGRAKKPAGYSDYDGEI